MSWAISNPDPIGSSVLLTSCIQRAFFGVGFSKYLTWPNTGGILPDLTRSVKGCRQRRGTRRHSGEIGRALQSVSVESEMFA
jgi:hypothetical protein